MKSKIKEILKKNKRLILFLKKSSLMAKITTIYILKTFNIFRRASCNNKGIRCEEDVFNRSYKYTLFGQDTPVCCRTHLYEITRDITSILNKNHIEYFIMYGTLLGQVRHNQTFIPWDTDVDIVVMKKEQLKVEELLLKELSFTDYYIQKNEEILKINFSETNLLHMDIYFVQEEDGYLIDKLNEGWIKNKVQIKDIYPLKQSKLYDLNINIPQDSIKILKDTYGNDCLTKAYKKYALKQKYLDHFDEGHIVENFLRKK